MEFDAFGQRFGFPLVDEVVVGERLWGFDDGFRSVSVPPGLEADFDSVEQHVSVGTPETGFAAVLLFVVSRTAYPSASNAIRIILREMALSSITKIVIFSVMLNLGWVGAFAVWSRD